MIVLSNVLHSRGGGGQHAFAFGDVRLGFERLTVLWFLGLRDMHLRTMGFGV